MSRPIWFHDRVHVPKNVESALLHTSPTISKFGEREVLVLVRAESESFHSRSLIS